MCESAVDYFGADGVQEFRPDMVSKLDDLIVLNTFSHVVEVVQERPVIWDCVH